MITTETLHVSSRSSSFEPFALAPYGYEDLVQTLPLSFEAVQMQGTEAQLLFTGDPRVFMDFEAQGDQHLSWGIYRPKIAPQNFLGYTGLSSDTTSSTWAEHYTMNQFGIQLWRPGCYKGLGTLATLATSLEGFGDGVSTVYAHTLEQNKAMQAVFRKLGFSYMWSKELYDTPLQPWQKWQLSTPAAIAKEYAQNRIEASSAFELIRGWRRFQHIAADVHVERNYDY